MSIRRNSDLESKTLYIIKRAEYLCVKVGKSEHAGTDSAH